MTSHAEFLRAEHGDAELVEAIKRREWRALPGLSERDRVICALSEKLSAHPTRMTREDWEPVRALGYDERACLELAHVVGIFNYLTRMADGFGLQLDEETMAAARTGEPLRHAEVTSERTEK